MACGPLSACRAWRCQVCCHSVAHGRTPRGWPILQHLGGAESPRRDSGERSSPHSHSAVRTLVCTSRWPPPPPAGYATCWRLPSPPAGEALICSPVPPAGRADSMARREACAAAAENALALDPNGGHYLRELLLVAFATTMDPAWLLLAEGERALPALPVWLTHLDPQALFASVVAKWVRGAAQGWICSEEHAAAWGHQ